jgi:hypothetical protein
VADEGHTDQGVAMSDTTPDVTKLAQEILIGRHDDHLKELVEAIGQRAVETRTEVRWRLTFDDLVVDEDNVTLLELERVEQLTDRTWLTVQPRNKASHCLAFLQAALEQRKGLSASDARDQLAGLTARQVVDGVLSEYVVSPAPFDSPDSRTTS